jgi:hypothetical protein
MRWLTRTRSNAEDGAVIVLVVVMVLTLVGMAALVVDVGAVRDERRQLQNGADAGALGVAQLIAQTCQSGGCDASLLQGKAQDLADANARDGTTKLDPLALDYPNQQVTVKTRSLQRDGRTILPYWFAQAVTGGSGTIVTASAKAGWGGLGKAPVVPLTLSKAAFDCATTDGTIFGVTKALQFHKTAPSGCSLTSGEMPGGFGWLKDNLDGDANDCNVTPSVSRTFDTDPGLSGPPGHCDPSVLLDKDILLPIFDQALGNGANGTFHIYGFAMFHLTGYTFPSSGTGGTVTCGSNACVAGRFIKFVGIGEYGGPNLGNRVALLS